MSHRQTEWFPVTPETLRGTKVRGGAVLLLMEDDFDSDDLLSCPIEMVHCDAGTLKQLLLDLNSLASPSGFDPSHHADEIDGAGRLIVFPGDAPVASDDIRARKTVVLGPTLEIDFQLRPQIERILGGRQSRLELPRGFPHKGVESLCAARAFPRARVQLHSEWKNWILVDCPVSTVRVDETDLYRLIGEIDAWEGVHRRTKVYPPFPMGRLSFLLQRVHSQAKHDSEIWILPWLEPLRARIESTLRGDRPLLPA